MLEFSYTIWQYYFVDLNSKKKANLDDSFTRERQYFFDLPDLTLTVDDGRLFPMLVVLLGEE